MRRFLWLVLASLLVTNLAGCGSSRDEFVFTGSATTAPDGRQVVVNHNLVSERSVGLNIVAFEFSGLDNNGQLNFGPDRRDKAPSITLAIPFSTTEFRIAYLDANGNVVGVYQMDLPEGSSPLNINDPDFIDATAFVASISIAPTSINLVVLQEQTLTVTAQLENNSSLDVTDQSNLTSGNPGIASLQGNVLTGVAGGSSQISAQLLNRSSTATATVVDLSNSFLLGLMSTIEGLIPGDGDSFYPALSYDSRWVVFESDSTNLVNENTNNRYQVYLKNRETGEIQLISRNASGNPGDADSYGVQISGNGRFVAFYSNASLLPLDTNDRSDIYLYDIETESMELISVNQAGTNGGNQDSTIYGGSMSVDGRFVAFSSRASDLVPGVTNEFSDVFLRDRQTGTTELISVSTNGTRGNGDSYVYTDHISSDGRFVTFYSYANNLADGIPDNNRSYDSFVRDRQAGTTRLISTNASGEESADRETYITWMSDDGQRILVSSSASNLVNPPVDNNNRAQIYLYDVGSSVFTLLTTETNGDPLAGDSYEGVLSADGRYLLFVNRSMKFTPVNERNQVIIRDLQTGEYRIVSANSNGEAANRQAYSAGQNMTPDGRFIVFYSSATDLAVQQVPQDNPRDQIYSVRNPFLPLTQN